MSGGFLFLGSNVRFVAGLFALGRFGLCLALGEQCVGALGRFV